MDREQMGRFISECRRELGLTQQELAEQLHVTNKAVSKWERGLSYPDVTLMEPEHFVRLARRHGMDHILFGTDSPWGGQREGVEDMERLPLAPEEREAVLGGNARRLLGL